MSTPAPGDAAPPPPDDSSAMAPLEGEPGIPNVAQRRRVPLAWRGMLAVGLTGGALLGLAGLLIHRAWPGDAPEAEARAARPAARPTAAAAEPKRLDMSPVALPGSSRPGVPAPTSAASTPPGRPVVPALEPTEAELAAAPIGIRRSPATAGGRAAPPPEDAAVMLLSTRAGLRPSTAAAGLDDAVNGADPLQNTQRQLQAYQRQLEGLLNNLGQATQVAADREAAPARAPAEPPPMASALPSPSQGLFGGQLQASATPRVAAGHLGNRSLTLPKGTAFTCALKTRIVSAASGLVGCQVQRNVYSDDGRVLLVERGSHLDGEYRIGAVRPGTVRIPVLWTRLRTPMGVTVDLESPGTGALGESGVDGYVDNRWAERLGAAMLLSVIDDSVKLIVQNQTQETDASTVVLPSTTANTSKLAEKVLDSTINIPPLIYQNQGAIVGIYVARDLDFSTVYALQPSRDQADEGAR